jgi:hypothetical protein
MIRLLASAAFTVAPVHEPDGMITRVAWACGPGMTRINGVCVTRTTVRHARRCARWSGGACMRSY